MFQNRVFKSLETCNWNVKSSLLPFGNPVAGISSDLCLLNNECLPQHPSHQSYTAPCSWQLVYGRASGPASRSSLLQGYCRHSTPVLYIKAIRRTNWKKTASAIFYPQEIKYGGTKFDGLPRINLKKYLPINTLARSFDRYRSWWCPCDRWLWRHLRTNWFLRHRLTSLPFRC